MTDRRLLHLDVENFRSLRDVSLPLGDLTVLVGSNGVGKSNVLKVFSFLADIIRNDLSPALDVRGGFDEVAFWGGSKPPTLLRIGLQATWTSNASVKAPDEYQLSIKRTADQREPSGYRLSRQESFTFKRTKGRGRRIRISGENAMVTDTELNSTTQSIEDSGERRSIGIRKLSSGLSTLPRLARSEGGAELGTVADHLSSFRVFDVDVVAARLPVRESGHGFAQLSQDAGNLADFMMMLQQYHPDSWAQLVEDAKAVLPGLQDIVFASQGGASRDVTIELQETGLRRLTPLADASFGTVRLLGLLALFHDPDPPALTCIEEIDHGLHPQALELLVERLREATSRSQYIVATHSPALVDRLRPEEFVVCERDERGASLIPAIDTERVRRIVAASEGLPLGELWFAGALGGSL
ncbi:putative ATPase [Streptacidiphilus sp. MAP12-20]|uniref:AAA family ATPase n=1 Tax=Streptacidiphilus sp. MAP12-20 TaxID=3156299 RepID=UPI003514B256